MSHMYYEIENIIIKKHKDFYKLEVKMLASFIACIIGLSFEYYLFKTKDLSVSMKTLLTFFALTLV
jgi:hypothetical protein